MADLIVAHQDALSASPVIDRVEQAMLFEMDGEDLPVTHHVGEVKGIYLREGRMKRGHYILGHKHKTKHYMVIFSGKMRFLDGDKVVTITGPAVFTCEPNARKLLYILEEVHGMNIMATDLTDVAAIEDELVEKSDLYTEWKARMTELSAASAAPASRKCPASAR